MKSRSRSSTWSRSWEEEEEDDDDDPLWLPLVGTTGLEREKRQRRGGVSEDREGGAAKNEKELRF